MSGDASFRRRFEREARLAAQPAVEGSAPTTRIDLNALAVDAAGGVLVATLDEDKVSRVATDGTITTVAGVNGQGFAGNGGPAAAAQLAQPQGGGGRCQWQRLHRRPQQPPGPPGRSRRDHHHDRRHRCLGRAGGRRSRGAGRAQVPRRRRTRRSGRPLRRRGGGPDAPDRRRRPDQHRDGRVHRRRRARSRRRGHSRRDHTDGSLYVADLDNSRVRRIDPAGVITTVAGSGTAEYAGDSGPATAAGLDLPTTVATDAAGNLYIGDADNYRVRKVDPNGIITTFMGTGTAGHPEVGSSADRTRLDLPGGVSVDPAGRVIITDYGDDQVAVVGTDGVVTTIAGIDF